MRLIQTVIFAAVLALSPAGALAEPINLLTTGLVSSISAAAFAPISPPSNAGGWTAGEISLAAGVNGILILAPEAVLVANARPALPGCSNCGTAYSPVGLAFGVVAFAGTLVAPFLSSLAVWGMGGRAGLTTSYGKVLGFSLGVRVLFLGIGLLCSLVPSISEWAAVSALALAAVGGALAELVAENPPPATTQPRAFTFGGQPGGIALARW